MQTMGPNLWNDFLQHERQKEKTPGAQQNIMYLKECGEFAWLLAFHKKLSAKDDGQV